MSWITPKTDWYGATDTDGNYTGDRWSADDYNRIKGNLQYLNDMAFNLYAQYERFTVGEDADYDSYPYADDLNALENELKHLADFFEDNFGQYKTFEANGSFIDYKELNRIESAQLSIYDHIKDLKAYMPNLTFTVGRKGIGDRA